MKSDLLKIMLTVFKHNDVASSFFKDVLKYEIDETCPYDTVYEQFDYEILSRFNAKEKKRRDEEKLSAAMDDCCVTERPSASSMRASSMRGGG